MKISIVIAALLFAMVPPRLAAQNHATMNHGTPAAIAAASSTASSQPVPTAQHASLRLEDFERIALAHNPTLAEANDLVRRSAGQSRQAGLYPNPSVGYEGGEIRGGSFGGGEQGAFISQTIVLGGKLHLRKRVFQAQQREDEAGAAEQRDRLLSDVDQRFYTALSAQEIVSLRQRLLKIAMDAVETAHQLANVGQADAPDVLQAEVEAGEAKVREVAAQHNYVQAFETLADTVGKPEMPVSRLEGALVPWPGIDAQNVIPAILRESPAVRRAEDGVTRAEAQLKSARREAIPDLQLRAGIQQDGEALDSAAVPRTPAGLIGFASAGVDLPIFNRNQGNVAAAKAELDRARNEVTRVQLGVRRAAEPLVQNILAEDAEAREYKDDMIPKATSAYNLYQSQYRAMASAYPQVIISQRTLFQLKVAYINTLAQLWKNAIALKYFTLADGLEAPASAGSSSTTVNLPGSQANANE